MRPGARKAAGMAVLVVVMTAYIAGVVVIADYLPDHWAARLIFYPVAGVAWVLPLRGLMRWINRTDDSLNGGG